MTLEEAGRQFDIPQSILEKYVSFGFIRKMEHEKSPEEYQDQDFERLGLIDTMIYCLEKFLEAVN